MDKNLDLMTMDELMKLNRSNDLSIDNSLMLREFLTALYATDSDVPYRVCSECGAIMEEGYCIDSGADYYCSDECLGGNMTPEEFDELYDEGAGDSYWTEWSE